MSNEQHEQLLEYITGRTRVTVIIAGRKITVTLYPNYPDTVSIDLVASLAHRSVIFEDLRGNGYGSPYHRRGYGRLLVNVMIQACHIALGQDVSDPMCPSITIYGKTSAVGDPLAEPERTQCIANRARFWELTGFRIVDPSAFSSPMKATLANLRLIKTNKYNSEYPIYVPIEAFWPVEQRPPFLQDDLAALQHITMPVNYVTINTAITAFEARSAELQSGESKLLRARYRRHMTKWIGTAALLLAAWTMVNGFKFTTNTAPYGLVLILSCVVGHVRASAAGTQWVRQVRSAIPENAHRRILEGYLNQLRIRIEEIEGEAGFLWRLFPGLEAFSRTPHDTLANDLYEMSRKHLRITRRDHIVKYLEIIEEAKQFALHE